MQEANVFKGYWFSPNKPEQKVAGILHFTPYETLKLELIGGFETPKDYLKNMDSEILTNEDIIWGIDKDAKKITLVNCHKYGSLNFSSEFPMISYSVQYAIIGKHLRNWDEKVFFKLDIELPLFTQWVNYRRVGFSMPYCNTEQKWLGFDIKFRVGDFEDTTLKINDTLSVTFKHNCKLPEPNSFKREIEELYTLEIHPDTETDFWTLILEAKKFSKFLALACQSEIDFMKLTLFSRNHYQELNNKKRIYHPIQLFYKHQKPTIITENQKSDRFLFDYQKVKEELPTVINKWYSFDDTMAPILQHLIDSINNKPAFRSVDFLVVCQALEGFHTRFKNPGRKYLSDRIQDLINEFKYVKNVRDIPVNVTVNSRNYYSHLYLEDHREIYKGSDLYKLSKSLRTLLICCFLKFIGFSDDKIKKIVEK